MHKESSKILSIVLNSKWEGVKIALGTWIIPLVTTLVTKLNEGVAAWSFIFGVIGKGQAAEAAKGASGRNLAIQNSKRAGGTGGWLTVPSGYPSDSYTVGLTSGEKYNVQPAGGGGGGMDTAAVIAAIKANKIDEQKLSRSIRDAILVAMG